MARKYKKDIKVVLPHIDPFRDIAVYGAGEEMIKAMGGVVHAGIKKPAIVPTSNNPYFKKYGDGGTNKTKLSKKDEPLFNEFYKTLPNNLRVDDPTYDIRGYWDSEGRPNKFNYDQPKDSDGYYHAYSINSNTGEYLKSPLHPTFRQAVEEDRKIGYRPITNMYGRNIAIENKSIADPEEESILINTEGPKNYIKAYGGYKRKYADGGIEKPTFGRSETYAEFAKNEAIRNEITAADQIKQNKSNKFSYKQKDKVKNPEYEIQLPELTIRPEESSKKELDISINPTKQPPALNFIPPRIPGSMQEAQAMLDSGELKASPPDYSFGTKQQAKLALKLLGLRYPAAAVAGSLWDVYDGDYKEAALNVMPFKKFGAIGQGTGAAINANDVYDQFMKVKKERETYKENKNYSKGGVIKKYGDGGVKDKEVPINAANPYLILDEGKEFTVRPEEESPEDTYANYMANKNKDASLAEAMFVTPIVAVASYPQAAMMKALTGKYGEPSDKIGYENPEGFLQHAWNFGVNAIADPTNISGVGLIDDVAKMGLKGAAKNSIKNTGNALYSIADNIDNTVGNIGKRVNKGLYSTGDFIDRNVNNIQAAVTGDYKKAIKQRGTGLATYNNPSLDEGKLAFEQRKAEKLAFWETPEGNQRLADHLERNNSPLSAKEFKRDFKDNVHYSTAIKERRVYQKELIEKADFEFHKKRDLEKKMDSIYGRISRARAVNKDPNIPANIKKANAEDLNNLSKEWQDTFDETTYQEELLKKLEKDIELHNFDKDNAYSWGNDIYIGEDLSHPVNLGGTMEHELSGHAVDMKSQVAGYKPKINNTSITQNLLDNVDLEASDMPDHIQELFRKHGDKKELKKFLKSMTKENYSPEYQQFLQNPIGYFKGSKNYWLKGAKGQNNEPTAFMAEARDYLFKKGHTKTLEEPITEDILEKAFTEYRKDRNMKGMYRLFDIVNPTKKSIKTLTKEINALPIIAAPILGATAVGTLTDQLPEQAPAQYSYGGYYKKYK